MHVLGVNLPDRKLLKVRIHSTAVLLLLSEPANLPVIFLYTRSLSLRFMVSRTTQAG